MDAMEAALGLKRHRADIAIDKLKSKVLTIMYHYSCGLINMAEANELIVRSCSITTGELCIGERGKDNG